MGASLKASGGGGRGRRRRARHAPMSKINVTPMVDVMLVLLIIFMVAAPMLQSGLEVDLPKAQGKSLQAPTSPPIEVSIKANGDTFIGQTQFKLDELAAKLKAIAKNGVEDRIYFRADAGAKHGVVMQVVGRVQEAGFLKHTFISVPEEGR